jgi:hypothetical protein
MLFIVVVSKSIGISSLHNVIAVFSRPHSEPVNLTFKMDTILPTFPIMRVAIGASITAL